METKFWVAIQSLYCRDLGWKEAGLKENCIAIQLGVLQEVADLVKGFVLQHSGLRWAVSKVYCNTGRLGLECIAIQLANLYYEEARPVSRYSGLESWARAGRAGTAPGAQAAGVWGERVRGRAGAGLGRAGAGAGVGALSARARYARPERCDTAGAPATRPPGTHDTAPLRPRYDRPRAAMRAPGRASAHLGLPTGPAGCSCTRLGFSTWFSTR